MPVPCPRCGCVHGDARSMAAHAVISALVEGDLDRAIESGLLADIDCEACAPHCQDELRTARAQRLNALTARERHRAREARLQARALERAARRGTAPASARPESRPPLPPAAAAALARAKARAAERGGK